MKFSRLEYWSGLPFPTPGDLPNPGIEAVSPTSPEMQADSLPRCHLGSKGSVASLKQPEPAESVCEPDTMEATPLLWITVGVCLLAHHVGNSVE